MSEISGKNWDVILINKKRIEKELDKALVINYDEDKNFIYPKKFAFPKNNLLEDHTSFENAEYVNLSFPIESDFKTVTVKNKKGIKDENGKWINEEKILSLNDLKEHFKQESIEIRRLVKDLKENA